MTLILSELSSFGIAMHASNSPLEFISFFS